MDLKKKMKDSVDKNKESIKKLIVLDPFQPPPEIPTVRTKNKSERAIDAMMKPIKLIKSKKENFLTKEYAVDLDDFSDPELFDADLAMEEHFKERQAMKPEKPVMPDLDAVRKSLAPGQSSDKPSSLSPKGSARRTHNIKFESEASTSAEKKLPYAKGDKTAQQHNKRRSRDGSERDESESEAGGTVSSQSSSRKKKMSWKTAAKKAVASKKAAAAAAHLDDDDDSDIYLEGDSDSDDCSDPGVLREKVKETISKRQNMIKSVEAINKRSVYGDAGDDDDAIKKSSPMKGFKVTEVGGKVIKSANIIRKGVVGTVTSAPGNVLNTVKNAPGNVKGLAKMTPGGLINLAANAPGNLIGAVAHRFSDDYVPPTTDELLMDSITHSIKIRGNHTVNIFDTLDKDIEINRILEEETSNDGSDKLKDGDMEDDDERTNMIVEDVKRKKYHDVGWEGDFEIVDDLPVPEWADIVEVATPKIRLTIDFIPEPEIVEADGICYEVLCC